MLNVTEALRRICATVSPSPTQSESLLDALGTILASDIVSTGDSPPFDKSMMDGFAVRFADLTSESVVLDITGEILAGQVADQSLPAGAACRIMTGAPIPQGADSVIPVELTEMVDETRVRLNLSQPPRAGWNVILTGSNMKAGENVISAGTLVRPQEVALLAEMGFARVEVRRPPRVAILATGDELVDVDETPGPGQIRNSNAIMLAAQVRAAGAEPVVLGIARDNPDELRAKILQGLSADFLCLSGGVSAGQRDLVPQELASANVQEVFHKVAMKPGKPVWFGTRNSPDCPPCHVFGLPGNPVSSMVCFELFVKTALRCFSGVPSPEPQLIEAVLQQEFSQRGDREVWFPAYVQISQGEVQVTPTGWKGSSDLRSTVEANSSVVFPPGERTYLPGESLQVLLWSGSHLPSKLPVRQSVL